MIFICFFIYFSRLKSFSLMLTWSSHKFNGMEIIEGPLPIFKSDFGGAGPTRYSGDIFNHPNPGGFVAAIIIKNFNSLSYFISDATVVGKLGEGKGLERKKKE